MKIDAIREHALPEPGAREVYPFGPKTAVFKVQNKIFMLARVPRCPLEINLKCNPDRALMLREIFDAVEPGYHMNKRHWNTIILEGSVPDATVLELIDHSYDLVVAKLTALQRNNLNS